MHTVPRAIRWIVLATCAATIGVGLIEALISQPFGLPNPYLLTLLTPTAVKSFFLWTPVSYMFTHFEIGLGLSFNLLISLAIHMYIIWVFGRSLLERIGEREFLIVYLGGGIATGVVTYLLMYGLGVSGILSGSTAAIVAISTVWVFYNPDAQILLFFVLPVQARWLLLGLVGASALVNLSAGEIPDLMQYVVGGAWGYGYAVIRQCLTSPFPQTHDFDLWLARKWRGWG